jgi:hypothetical protein
MSSAGWRRIPSCTNSESASACAPNRSAASGATAALPWSIAWPAAFLEPFRLRAQDRIDRAIILDSMAMDF